MEKELQSRSRIESYLRDARAHLSQIAESMYSEELKQFDAYLQSNELKLALDILDAIVEKSAEDFRVIELMALAAASMQLIERQTRYDKLLSDRRGWQYRTSLPESS